MHLSVALAQIFGMFYVILGLAMLFNTNYYRKLYADFFKNPPALLLWGILALFVGIFIILFHNYWVYSWETIITVIGWCALIEGVVLLLSPQQLEVITSGLLKKTGFVLFTGTITLIVGLVLGYFGFFI